MEDHINKIINKAGNAIISLDYLKALEKSTKKLEELESNKEAILIITKEVKEVYSSTTLQAIGNLGIGYPKDHYIPIYSEIKREFKNFKDIEHEAVHYLSKKVLELENIVKSLEEQLETSKIRESNLEYNEKLNKTKIETLEKRLEDKNKFWNRFK